MKSLNILILDYSVDRKETELIKPWLPKTAQISSLFIDSEKSFPDDLLKKTISHVIHTGSALSITEKAPFTEKATRYIRYLRDEGVPQMGICYGHQLLCLAFLGIQAVRRSPNGFEAGWCTVSFNDHDVNIPNIGKTESVWQHHFDEVTALPEGSHIFASNSHSVIQGFINKKLCLFGTQFHPEFDKESGNAYFRKDEELLRKHNYNVNEIVEQGPSIETGKIFFNFFITYFSERSS